MACYHPLGAYRLVNQRTENGKAVIVFSEKQIQGKEYELIDLPCGQCIGCRMAKSKEWAVRCVNEAAQWQDNVSVTCTISEENMNDDYSLEKHHWVNFMKRLRSVKKGTSVAYKNGKMQYPIRYFHCGEYGDQDERPHHHAILFNIEFDDKEYWCQSKSGEKLYHSDELDALWQIGYCYLGNVTWASCAYVARYILKKVNGDQAPVHYSIWDEDTGEPIGYREPEYITMSRMPGIGHNWYSEFKGDIYPKDYLTVDGKRCTVPKYYDRVLEKEDPDLLKHLKEQRKEEASNNEDNYLHYRLRAKEKCQEARNQKLPRSLKA